MIPSYNRKNILNNAICSVMKQTFLDWELWIIDDGSNDNTKDSLAGFLKDPRIHYKFQSNQGVSAARNKGAELATANWLVFLDSDDELLPNALEKFYSEILNQPKSQVFVAGFISKKSKEDSGNEIIPKDGLFTAKLPGTFTLKKFLFLEIGAYDIRLKFSENTELFHRIRVLGLNVINAPFPTMIYFDKLDGGSKNLRNMTDSLYIILDKHKSTLGNHVTTLYLQIIGVNHIRFGEYGFAKKVLWKAWLFAPFKLGPLARYFIACFPEIAKKFYPPLPKIWQA